MKESRKKRKLINAKKREVVNHPERIYINPCINDDTKSVYIKENTSRISETEGALRRKINEIGASKRQTIAPGIAIVRRKKTLNHMSPLVKSALPRHESELKEIGKSGNPLIYPKIKIR